jgi:pyruvate,water dikinase
MPWQTLDRFDDRAIPKLHNLVIANRAGLRVPRTVWARASYGPQPWPAREGVSFPCIVRSGSPTEDAADTSNAGQFKSLVVPTLDEFDATVAEVIEALPVADGKRQGIVFLQPLVACIRAGVTFFDGFYYEESSSPGGNQAITAGLDRGEIARGHVKRGDARDDWLLQVHRLFGCVLDMEWAAGEGGGADRVLLQVRPALFPVRRCETLSLANHKEILGDPPSPWMVGLLMQVSRPAMGFFEATDPAIAEWQEPYAIEVGERAWMNFSAFFRITDRWGLPRTAVTEGVGGQAEGPLDSGFLPGRLVRSLPVFVKLIAASLSSIARVKARLRALDEALDGEATLPDLQRLNVQALEFSIRTNFAVMGLLSGVARFRKAIGLRQAGRLVTAEMMTEYAALASRPTLDERLAGLDRWLARFGHRGPLESDPMRPRFSELHEALRRDLARGPAPCPAARSRPSTFWTTLTRPLFLLDEFREAFRDRTMRWWQRLRERVLAEAEQARKAGFLDAPDDVFLLRAEDLADDPSIWRSRAAARKARVDSVRFAQLPATAPRDLIEEVLAQARMADAPDRAGLFFGIGLDRSSRPVMGTAVRALDLGEILQEGGLPESPVLVVETLEPSWAVVFPRFAAVVSELGGELSHASILLREAGIPAVVNASGAFHSIWSGDTVSVDPATGEIRVGEVRPDPANSGT